MRATTTLVGLIGWPVSHSVSPVMHNAAFAERGLEWCYVPLPVRPEPPERIGEAVQGVRALGLRGANVTVPHKQAVIPHLDSVEPAARAIGAVNTILVDRAGRLVGDNTDAAGFATDLKSLGVTVEGRRALVLGAGGSARAIVYALAQQGAETITVVNRTPARAMALAASLQVLFDHCRILAATEPAPAMEDAAADLVVNCTVVGMTPNVEASPWPERLAFRSGQTVYDLIYNPRETMLLRRAALEGARALGGLGMLVHQAALAFERWTGVDAPVDVIRAAALMHFAAAALDGQGASDGPK